MRNKAVIASVVFVVLILLVAVIIIAARWVLEEIRLERGDIVVHEQELANGCCVRILAEPTERCWSFYYEVNCHNNQVVPMTFFGTGRRRHVRQEIFRIERLPNTDVYLLFEVSNPDHLFLIFDCHDRSAYTVALDYPNDPRLLEAVRQSRGNMRSVIDNFEGRD